jgi:uncharacterized membrane protein YdjX (TVP38/TMEM64 family)
LGSHGGTDLRLILLIAALSLLLLLPFLAMGECLEVLFGGSALVETLREGSSWGWLVGLSLLVADLLLPVPATAVMAALGAVYGPLAGGLLAASGSFLAGSLGFFVCWVFGSAGASRVLGPADLDRARRLADDVGPWLVAGSRALPLLPEVVACAAGLVRMRPARFLVALACGALPMGFVMATLGHLGSDRPLLTIGAVTAAPLLLWLLLRRRLG